MKASEISVGKRYLTRSTAARRLGAPVADFGYAVVQILTVEKHSSHAYSSHGRIALCDILKAK